MTDPGAAAPGSSATAAAALLVDRLVAAGRTIAVAESLTGGALTDALVAVPGASRCLRGGVVAYATDLKAALLGVPADLLARHGAVHPDVAVAMAAGVRERLGADYGLATTGVAGPDPQDGRPPGTAHVALIGPAGSEVRSLRLGPLGRAAVRRRVVEAALELAVLRAGDTVAGPPATHAQGDRLA